VADPPPAQLELPKIVLEITRGRAQHMTRQVRSRAFLIGTAPDCDLVLADPRFDPVHSYLFVTPRRITIRQLGQGPPLSIDGRPAPWAVLADGDRIEMASYEFQVRITWPAGSAHAVRAGRKGESLPLTINHDRATERLLQEVERSAGSPRLTLYVGDDEDEAELKPTGRRIFNRPDRQARQKKASL
jgi:hypothetical protein